jgi:hypothetical protein
MPVWRSTITNQSQSINSGSIRHKNHFFFLPVVEQKGDTIYLELAQRHLEQHRYGSAGCMSLQQVLPLRHTARSAMTRVSLVQIGCNAFDE